MNSQALIRIVGVSHTYPGKGKTPPRQALKEIDLDIQAGEMIALLGPNGSGKSTLLRILTTALRAERGTVEIGGHDLLKEPRAVRRQLGVVFQKPALDRKMSVRENLVAAGQLYGMARRDMDARIKALLEGLKLRDRLDEKVEALSGGLARRVELAKALLPEPQVLILDEPTTGLDPISRQEFWHEVGNLRGEGTTVLVTTHILDEAAACDRVAIMHEGDLLECAPPEVLQQSIGRQVLALKGTDLHLLLGQIEEAFHIRGRLVDGVLRFSLEEPFSIDALLNQFSQSISDLSLSHPSLDDVFVHLTGHRLTVGGELAS
ncbi:MAG: ABC transporter ATP-binding protein [Candidatus Latescibacterota bacterium]